MKDLYWLVVTIKYSAIVALYWYFDKFLDIVVPIFVPSLSGMQVGYDFRNAIEDIKLVIGLLFSITMLIVGILKVIKHFKDLDK